MEAPLLKHFNLIILNILREFHKFDHPICSFMIKKAETISTPTQIVSEVPHYVGGMQCSKWKLTTNTTLQSLTTEFEVDKAFDEKVRTGRLISSVTGSGSF